MYSQKNFSYKKCLTTEIFQSQKNFSQKIFSVTKKFKSQKIYSHKKNLVTNFFVTNFFLVTKIVKKIFKMSVSINYQEIQQTPLMIPNDSCLASSGFWRLSQNKELRIGLKYEWLGMGKQVLSSFSQYTTGTWLILRKCFKQRTIFSLFCDTSQVSSYVAGAHQSFLSTQLT